VFGKTLRQYCLFSLLLASPALAGDPAGWWSSSTGSRVNIWANMEQVIVTVHSPQGGQSKYYGQWTRFSDHFQYAAAGTYFNCSFNGPNQITVTNQSTGAVTIWTRGNAAPAQPARPSAPPSTPGGSTWISNTGSTVQLSSSGHQVSVTIIGADGRRHQGAGRWINYPHTFDYSIPGYPGVAQCSVLPDGRIQVVYNQTVSYWTKQY
jgi:hypothetical protein